jgi:hypothetical protein
LQAQERDDRTGLLRAADHGLAVLEQHRLTLGSSELRARATVRGAELARLAVGRAAADGSARELLRWSERWRATLQVAPPPRPPQDPEALAELAALRALPDGRRGLQRPPGGTAAAPGGGRTTP